MNESATADTNPDHDTADLEVEYDHEASYEAKADFSDIYDQRDPRAYYRTLGPMDYRIPEHGHAVFRPLLEMVSEARGSSTVLDVCCSYGVNAALLNHDITMDDLYRRYCDGELDDLDADQLVAADRAWFDARRRTPSADVIGLDVAPNAVSYAVDSGLLADGIVADLEEGDPTDEAATLLGGVDLVTVTGGIGYVRERTFARILAAAGRLPWVAALSLRWIDFSAIAEELGSAGLTVEKLDGHLVPQRHFHDADEREATLSTLEEMGLDPAEERRQDAHLAELYLARPADAVTRVPIEEFGRFLTRR